MRIKERLKEEAEIDYKKFSAALIPNINNVLGIRLPILRRIAKEVYTNGEYEKFLNLDQFEYMEETMLQGMIIGLLKKTPEEILHYVKEFVPRINNWAVCDCFCAGLKFTNKNPEIVWKFIQPYFKSNEEYSIRFAYVMLLSYFVRSEYIDEVLSLIDKFRDDRYYAKMAVAWLVSVCYIKYPDKTEEYLLKSKLEKWTYNKSIQKICESLRINKQIKEKLKKLRR